MRANLIELWRRARTPQAKVYTATHPMTLLVAIGAIIVGGLVICVPAIESRALISYLPETLGILWPWVHLFGGLAAVWGVVLGKPQWEAAGLTLLTFTFAALATAISDYDDPPIAVSMLVVSSLSLACLARVVLLVAWADRYASNKR